MLILIYNHKTLYDEWSEVELLNYFTGKCYEPVQMSNEIFEKYFKNVKYDAFIPEKQLVFEEDKLYWLIY